MEASWISYLDEFCNQQASIDDDWNQLPDASRLFFENLGLPSLHPYCINETAKATIFPSALPMGPPHTVGEGDSSFWPLFPTVEEFWDIYGHPVMALVQIWVLLFAAYIAPVGIGYMIIRWRQRNYYDGGSKKRGNDADVVPRGFCIVHTTTLYMSWLIFTDEQYVLEFGRSYGASLLVGVLSLCPQQLRKRTLALIMVLLITLPPWRLRDPGIFPLIPPGIYSNTQNKDVQNILQEWHVPEYSKVATPWQFTGDARTGLPYLFSTLDDPPKFHRVWLETDDHEYVALDIAFPRNGHDPSKPLYLVFHGLNGGSAEGYVNDLAASRTKQGSTVVVMVARGLMDTPILGWTLFHGARISDAHTAASTIRKRVLSPNQTLAGVGYSIGAIVLNHYVAAYKEQVALDVSVTISGALYCQRQEHYIRSKETWQVPVAAHTKEMLLIPKWGARLLHQLGNENYHRLRHASSVVDIDRFTGVLYSGFDSLANFYREMSPIDPFDETKKDSRHFAIPHLILQSFDDPLSIWTTNADNDPNSPLYPPNLVNDQENLVVMLTSQGGHVGWPIGMWPNSFAYMNEFVAAGFVDAFDKSKTNYGRGGEGIAENNSPNNGSGEMTCSALHPQSVADNNTTATSETKLDVWLYAAVTEFVRYCIESSEDSLALFEFVKSQTFDVFSGLGGGTGNETGTGGSFHDI